MTVDSAYRIVQYQDDNETVYRFMTESIGDPAIQVWTVDGAGVRQQLTLDVDYTLRFDNSQAPTFIGGTVTLTTPLSGGKKLSLERKTPIVQELDPPVGEPFPAEGFEYEIDRICFIQQEIEGHFCDCRVENFVPPGEPITVIPEVIRAETQNWLGFGQDVLINAGANEQDMMIYTSVLGNNKTEVTRNGGQTWETIQYGSGEPRQILSMYRKGNFWHVLTEYTSNIATSDWVNWGNDPTSPSFRNEDTLAYSHGVAFVDSDTWWRGDGNNNSNDDVRKLKTQSTVPTEEPRISIPDTTTTNVETHRIAGDYLFVAFGPQGPSNNPYPSFYIVNILADQHIGTFVNSINSGRNLESYAGIIKTTATAAQNGVVADDNAVIQTISNSGVVTDSLVNFGEAIDYVCCHVGKSSFLYSAHNADRTKLLIANDGGTFAEIVLPYPAHSTNDFQREIRYLGNNKYAIAYIAERGANAPYVLLKVTL